MYLAVFAAKDVGYFPSVVVTFRTGVPYPSVGHIFWECLVLATELPVLRVMCTFAFSLIQNQISTFLANHHRGDIGVCVDDHWHN